MLENWGWMTGTLDQGDPASDRYWPIVVLVGVDQLCGDCLGIDGHPIVETLYRIILRCRVCGFSASVPLPVMGSGPDRANDRCRPIQPWPKQV